jgi:hypothetical protein
MPVTTSVPKMMGIAMDTAPGTRRNDKISQGILSQFICE